MNDSVYSKRILIVDDEPEIVESLVTYLEICGFTNTHRASNGIEAYKLIEKDLIDLVISDVRMPEMDGVQLLEKTLVNHPGKPIFLMITGQSELTSIKAKEKGAKELLEKPLDFENLVKQIERYLQ